MNKLSKERQTQVLSALVEGNSIRSIERMTGIHRDTIMRLGVRVGETCAQFMDETLRNLPCERIQVDEIWAYCGKKQRHVKRTDDLERVGDVWTWVALDPDTKLVPCYHIGSRTTTDARAFMRDLESRLANRVQLSSDGFPIYLNAVRAAFGDGVDYGQIVKYFEASPDGSGRYSPPKVTSAERSVISGDPEQQHISTSHVERQNLTMRMQMRRFTRLTNGFSKKIENMKAAVGLHFCHYNFVRTHKTLKMTPAMKAGIVNHALTVGDLAGLS